MTFNIRPEEDIRGRVPWTETKLAMPSKPQDTVSLTMGNFRPEPGSSNTNNWNKTECKAGTTAKGFFFLPITGRRIT